MDIYFNSTFVLLQTLLQWTVEFDVEADILF